MEKKIEYGMVDLGLPSGLKWADRNVGAASPEAFGNYFMWGSTEPDTDNPCDNEHAPFNGGSSEFDEEYFDEHKSEWLTEGGTLKPEYDAAHVIMGGSWRMPTSVEIRELIYGTTHESGTLEGVYGMFFISKADSANRIFIPFSGRRYGINANGMGWYCSAWSSSICSGSTNFSQYIGINRYGDVGVCVSLWSIGLAVRGVHE